MTLSTTPSGAPCRPASGAAVIANLPPSEGAGRHERPHASNPALALARRQKNRTASLVALTLGRRRRQRGLPCRRRLHARNVLLA